MIVGIPLLHITLKYPEPFQLVPGLGLTGFAITDRAINRYCHLLFLVTAVCSRNIGNDKIADDFCTVLAGYHPGFRAYESLFTIYRL